MHRVTIVGLGLIGGSLGIALRRRGWRVAYVDPAVEPHAARSAEAADERLDTAEGDLIVLAAPADVALRQLRELQASPAVVTSVCSVMAPLREAAGDVEFVAGHPFAGSEKSGLAVASGDLFEERPWFVDRADPRVEELILAAGATPVVVDAGEHDRILALTSHLPQLISTALASLLADVDPRFVGSGARSLLRLAGSSYDVWRPVLEGNAANVQAAVDELVRVLRSISEADFSRANELYRRGE